MEAEQSFREYVRARTAQLSRVAYVLTGDFHLAEDLVQQTLLRVAERWQRVNAAGDPNAYVRRVPARSAPPSRSCGSSRRNWPNCTTTPRRPRR
jgi:DNA-directed RNA polymerase specialized sigma24 family protein